MKAIVQNQKKQNIIDFFFFKTIPITGFDKILII